MKSQDPNMTPGQRAAYVKKIKIKRRELIRTARRIIRNGPSAELRFRRGVGYDEA